MTPSERADFTARRKAAYEALHPETVRGVAGAVARHGDAMANLATASFADDQSEKTGTAARTIRRDAERGEKVTNSAKALLKGTKLDTRPGL